MLVNLVFKIMSRFFWWKYIDLRSFLTVIHHTEFKSLCPSEFTVKVYILILLFFLTIIVIRFSYAASNIISRGNFFFIDLDYQTTYFCNSYNAEHMACHP